MRLFVFMLSAVFGFVGTCYSGGLWGSTLLDPNSRSWPLPVIFSGLALSGVTFFIYNRGFFNFKSWDLLLLVFLPFLIGVGVGIISLVGYVKWADSHKLEQAKNFKYTPDEGELKWRAQVRNRNFISSALGVKFHYVSESKSDGAVLIEEHINTITVRFKNGKFGGAFMVLAKEPKQNLIDFLKEKYSSSFPDCLFYGQTFTGTESFEGNHFPNGYQQVARTGEKCPSLGIEINGDRHINTSFLMDSKHPEKYLYLVLADYPIPGFKSSDETPFPLKWHETIEFLDQ